VKAMLLRNSRVLLAIVLALLLGGGGMTNAQPAKVCQGSKKDTISVFGRRLKIALSGAFERMPTHITSGKYIGLFNLHDVTTSSGFVLRAKDTLVFYMTSIDRPLENDGGIATWQIINSILDKMPAFRMESGWNKLRQDYLYFVKLVLDRKPEYLFEFNFFFIENKLAFSLLQRPIKELGIIEQESYTLISTR
jgi:hypothetical protein